MRTHRAFLASLWVLFIAVLSFLPRHYKEELHTTGSLHDYGHILAFCGAAFMLACISQNIFARAGLLLAGLALGVCLEIGQHLIYATQIEWHDILLDTVGSVLGLLLALVFGRHLAAGKKADERL
jgi:VanZ family protein